MIRNILLLVLLLSTLSAEESSSDTIFELIQNDMQKYSQIATQTKQNVDYMPYIVSVLQSDELKQLGILSLKEALSLIPGVDTSIGMLGVQTPIFRGSNPFAVGQSKLIIDGVVVNDQMFGAYNRYLDMPIAIIERIEVIRGPGSLVNGINSYAGSINVVTKAYLENKLEDENSFFSSYGLNDYAMGGYTASFRDGDFKLGSDFFYQRNNQELPTGPDRFGNSHDAPIWLRNYALGINVTYKNFYLKSRFAKNESGVSYGQSFSLSEDDSDFIDVKNNFVEAGYSFNIAQGVKAKLSVGYFDEQRELQNKVMPDASIMMNMLYPQGYYFLVDYVEETLNERFEIETLAFKNHKITAGILLLQSSIEDKLAKHSKDGMKSFTQKDLLSNEKRKYTSLYLNDLISVSEYTTIDFGFNYDFYSDLDDYLCSRIALVHRYDDDNIYKLMYTHTHREPSWREQYLIGSHYFSSNINVEPEMVDAYEASYIRKIDLNSDIKLNIFYLKNENQIFAQYNPMRNSFSLDNYTESSHALYGIEAEYKTKLDENNRLYFNYSYVGGKNISDSLANSASNMAKAYYIYDINNNLSLSSTIKHVGKKDRLKGDLRDKVDAYTTVDVTSTYEYKPYDLTLSLSVKNLFDKIYYLPAPDHTYVNDFRQEGVNFLLYLEKRF